jgi:hypothetical protein
MQRKCRKPDWISRCIKKNSTTEDREYKKESLYTSRMSDISIKNKCVMKLRKISEYLNKRLQKAGLYPEINILNEK